MKDESWVVMDKDGRLACEGDAKGTAKSFDVIFPQDAPHRAVRVVPAEDVEARIAAAVASERERCAILCDGFEDATTSAREAEIARNLASKIRGLKP